MRYWLAICLMLAGLLAAPIPFAWAQPDDISTMIEQATRQLNGDGMPQDIDAAISGYADALQRLEALDERRIGDEIVVLNQLGFAYHITDRFAEAAGYFDAAYKMMMESGTADPAQVMQVRFNRAIAWRLSGRPRDAVAEFAALIPEFDALPEPEVFDRRGSLAYHFGLALIAIGQREDGRNVLKIAFSNLIDVNPPDLAILGEIAVLIGGTHLDAGEYREAIAEYERAIKILELSQPPDAVMLANTLTRIGVAKRALGDLEGALDAHGQALALTERALGPRDPLAAEIRSNRGVTYDSMGQRNEAREEYETALDIYTTSLGSNAVEVADTLLNLAGLLYQEGAMGKALAQYQAADTIYQTLDPPDPVRRAQALSNIGAIYMSLYAFNEAKAAMDEAEALLPADSRYAIEVRSNRTMLLVRLGQNDEALEQFDTLLADYRRIIGPESAEVARTEVNMGALLSGMGRHAEAVEHLRAGYVLFHKLVGPQNSQTVAAAGNLGYSLLLAGEVDQSFAAISHVLAAGKPGEPSRFAYELLGIYATALKMPTASMLFGKLAVNAQQQELAANLDLPKALREGYSKRFGGVHAVLAEALIADGLFSEAQFVSGLLKKEEFDSFTRGSAQTKVMSAGQQIVLTPSEERLSAQLNALIDSVRPAVDAAEAEPGAGPERLAAATAKSAVALRQLLDAAEAQRAEIQAERLKQNAARMAEARQSLRRYNGDAVLYHAVSLDTTLHVMVTRADLDEPVHVTVDISRQALAEKVYAALAAIERRDPGAKALLEDLDGLLIAPVREALSGGDASVVMLDVAGFLRYVPFAALNDGDRFLVEDFALAAYGPESGDTAEEIGSGSAGFGTTKAHGDFVALPGVARELEAIFKGNDGEGYLDGPARLDDDFTLAALKEALREKPRYLHIGSHFRFTPGNELGSSLLIGTGEEIGMDRFRTDPELRFPGVDLLVLSACETARGSGAEGAEIESLGMLAQHNGAGAVLATLWPIADEASAKLMSDFYEGLVVEGLDKARALQRAQIAMIRGLDVSAVSMRGVVGVEDDDNVANAMPAATAHPYFWSPFVLMGRWN